MRYYYLILAALLLSTVASGQDIPIPSGGGGSSGTGGGVTAATNQGIGGRLPGKPGNDKVYNAINYGADPTGVIASAAKIQTAYNAACQAASSSISNGYGVYVPSGTYTMEQPLILSCKPQAYLRGDGVQQTEFVPNFMGPAIVTAGGYTIADYGLSIATGLFSANSMVWASGALSYFDLNEIDAFTKINQTLPVAGPYDGLSAWTIQGFFKVSDTNPHMIWSSDGAQIPQRYAKTTNFVTYGMGFLYTYGGNIYGSLRINGVPYPINSTGGVTTGIWEEAELNFDGSNINLYVGPQSGTVSRVAQQTGLSGTVTQRGDENNFLGAHSAAFPHGATNYYWYGSMQSVRVSNVARHTGASFSADTANFGSDANTLALINNDLINFPVQAGKAQPIVQADKGVPPPGIAVSAYWLALHENYAGCCGGTYELGNFAIMNPLSTGLFADGSAVALKDIYVGGKDLGVSTGEENIELSSNASYGSSMQGINTIGRGVEIEVNSGLIYASNIRISGIGFGIADIGSSITHLYVGGPNAATGLCPVYVAAFSGAPPNTITIDDMQQDSENGGTFYAVCIGSGANVVIKNSEFAPGVLNGVALIGSPEEVTLGDGDVWWSTNAVPVDTQYATFGTSSSPIVFGTNRYFEGGSVPSGGYTTLNNYPFVVRAPQSQTSAPSVSVYPQTVPIASSAYQTCLGCTTLPAMTRSNSATSNGVDIAVLQFSGDPGTITPGTSDWTAIPSCDVHAQSWLNAFYRVATPTTSGTASFSWVNSRNVDGVLLSTNNVNRGSPVDTCFTKTQSGGSTITVPGGSAIDNNDLVLLVTSTLCCTSGSVANPPTGMFLVSSPAANTLFNIWAYSPNTFAIPNETVNGDTGAGGAAGFQLALRAAVSSSDTLSQTSGWTAIYQNESGVAINDFQRVQIDAGGDLQLGGTPQPTPTSAVFSEMIAVKDVNGQIHYLAAAPGPTASPTPTPKPTPTASPTATP